MDEFPLNTADEGADDRPAASEPRGAEARPPARRRLRLVLLWIVPLIIAGVALAWYGATGRYVSTDDAYVKQDQISISPQLAADVQAVHVAENERVNAGEPILALDAAAPRVAVQRAEAELARARAEVAGLKASYREKLGELAVARRTAEFSIREYERQQKLAAQHLVAATAVDAAHRAADLAQGAIAVLRLQAEQARARLNGDPDIPADEHPAVLAAAAELARARLDLEHTVVSAPQAGIVSHLPKVGDRVMPGAGAFAIVADGSLWVEANFKETDLANVRPGQSVTVEVDTYGGRVWHGTVASIAQATGAEFALLPPQNASGNWVKVVQRIPVRIQLVTDGRDPPLRNGMSATVQIDTGPNTHFDRLFAGRG